MLVKTSNSNKMDKSVSNNSHQGTGAQATDSIASLVSDKKHDSKAPEQEQCSISALNSVQRAAT